MAGSDLATDRPGNGALAGRTALVTGSGRNIGRAVALRFAVAGANVIINGHRDRAAIDAVAEEVRALGAQAYPVLADVSRHDQVEALVARAAERFEGIDILVSNVGLRPKQGFLDISLEDWDRVLRTNLSSAFFLARNLLPGMKARGWGRILHMSGHDGWLGATNRAHNVACKAALHGLSKALALEFGPFGVTVNTVVPGVIDTTRDENHYPGYRERYREIAEELPVRAVGTSEDVAEACLYLASPAAKHVTGQALHVNGGECF
ncbi:MAG: SDR family NAD(P)-dependent oxidoreductase [Acidobacteriota bacterium]